MDIAKLSYSDWLDWILVDTLCDDDEFKMVVGDSLEISDGSCLTVRKEPVYVV